MLCLADLAVGVLMLLSSHCHHVKPGSRCHNIVGRAGAASSQPISSPSLSDKHDCAIQDVKASRTLN